MPQCGAAQRAVTPDAPSTGPRPAKYRSAHFAPHLFRPLPGMKLLPVLCAALALAARVAAVDNVDAATKLPFSFEGSAMLIFYYTGRSSLRQ